MLQFYMVIVFPLNFIVSSRVNNTLGNRFGDGTSSGGFTSYSTSWWQIYDD